MGRQVGNPVSYQRVDNVLNHAPSDVSGPSRLILVAIAARMPGTGSTDGRPVKLGRDDFARQAAVGPNQVRQVLARLVARGLVIRVPVGKDRNGEPVFAHKGSVGQYAVPWFDAPTGCDCPECFKGAVQTTPSDAEVPSKESSTRPLIAPKGASGAAPLGPKGPSGRRKGAVQTAPLPIAKEAAKPLGAERQQQPEKTSGPTGRPLTDRYAGFTDAERIFAATVADLKPTDDEVRTAHSRWVERRNPTGLGLYRHIAKEGGVDWHAIIRDLRADALKSTIAELRRGPACIHGDPGGESLHPESGQPLCPHCRRGIPPPDLGPVAIDTYRAIYRASHGRDPSRQRMTAVARQAQHMREHGADHLATSRLATAAAIADLDLVEYHHAAKDKISA